jgi:hypothetical protein
LTRPGFSRSLYLAILYHLARVSQPVDSAKEVRIGMYYYYIEPAIGYDTFPGKTQPLILFLHGYGEIGRKGGRTPEE